MIGMIRRIHSQGKKSQREIARTTGLSRKTVSKWLEGPLQAEPKYQRVEQPGKLTAFHAILRQAIKVDALGKIDPDAQNIAPVPRLRCGDRWNFGCCVWQSTEQIQALVKRGSISAKWGVPRGVGAQSGRLREATPHAGD